MMSEWTAKTDRNPVTGETTRRWRRSTQTAGGHTVLYEVHELAGRYYWSANIMIKFRPDLSRLAYGTYAATPQGLAVAKRRASTLGNAALKAAKAPRHLTRAA